MSSDACRAVILPQPWTPSWNMPLSSLLCSKVDYILAVVLISCEQGLGNQQLRSWLDFLPAILYRKYSCHHASEDEAAGTRMSLVRLYVLQYLGCTALRGSSKLERLISLLESMGRFKSQPEQENDVWHECHWEGEIQYRLLDKSLPVDCLNLLLGVVLIVQAQVSSVRFA